MGVKGSVSGQSTFIDSELSADICSAVLTVNELDLLSQLVFFCGLSYTAQ